MTRFIRQTLLISKLGDEYISLVDQTKEPALYKLISQALIYSVRCNKIMNDDTLISYASLLPMHPISTVLLNLNRDFVKLFNCVMKMGFNRANEKLFDSYKEAVVHFGVERPYHVVKCGAYGKNMGYEKMECVMYLFDQKLGFVLKRKNKM